MFVNTERVVKMKKVETVIMKNSSSSFKIFGMFPPVVGTPETNINSEVFVKIKKVELGITKSNIEPCMPPAPDLKLPTLRPKPKTPTIYTCKIYDLFLKIKQTHLF